MTTPIPSEPTYTMTIPDQPAPRERGLLSRAIGIIVGPGDTFRSVVASPRPAGILFLVCLISGLAAGLPQFTERGQQAVLELQLRSWAQTGQTPTPEMQQTIQSMAPYSGYFALGSTFTILPVVVLVVAGVYWLIFNVILGGTADYKQVLGVVSHAQVIGALGALVAAPVQYLQGTLNAAGPFHLGALAGPLDPSHWLARLLTSLSFFGLWQAVVAAIGLATLYRRRATGIALLLLFFYIAFTALFFVAFPSLIGSRQ